MKAIGQTTWRMSRDEFNRIKEALDNGKKVVMGGYTITHTNYIAVNVGFGMWEFSLKMKER